MSNTIGGKIMLNLRQSARQLAQAKIRINWRDDAGSSYGSVGRITNSSTNGFCVQLDRRISAGTTVQIEAPELKTAGLAVVRYCHAKGMGFRVGLQYEGGPKR